MDPLEEKQLLLSGIEELKQQLVFVRGARCLDVLDRLETLRWCLESLVRREVMENRTPTAYKEAL